MGNVSQPPQGLSQTNVLAVYRSQINSDGDTSIKNYAVVPYIQGVTEPVKRNLNNCNIKVTFKNFLLILYIGLAI